MKYLILAASNYPGTDHALQGCLNDTAAARARLEACGYTVLADLRDTELTTAAWLAALRAAVLLAQPGDLVCHWHSHHGAQVPDCTGTEVDGLAEVWCPDDFDWSPERMITGPQMGALLAGLRPDVLWVDVADCCHAGGGLRDFTRARCLTPPDVRDWYARRTVTSPMVVSDPSRRAMLLAACAERQTAADATIKGVHCGAFSHYLLDAWTALPTDTYADVMSLANALLAAASYSQTPEIDCRPGDEGLPFLTIPQP